MASNGHRVVTNDEYVEIIESLMESQAILVKVQERIARMRFEPGWDGRSERRRNLKIQNGAYHRRDASLA